MAERNGDTAFRSQRMQYSRAPPAIRKRRGASLPAALQNRAGIFPPRVKSYLIISSRSTVTSADVAAARLGTRFGRMDLASQLALLAVEPFAKHFDSMPRERIAICLATRASSLSTDVEYWKGRDAAGGPSPTLFTYTLPSAAIGEIAIRHRLTGPNLCFVGSFDDTRIAHQNQEPPHAHSLSHLGQIIGQKDLSRRIESGNDLLAEASDLIARGEADGCVCIRVDVVSPTLAEMILAAPAATTQAFFVRRGEPLEAANTSGCGSKFLKR